MIQNFPIKEMKETKALGYKRVQETNITKTKKNKNLKLTRNLRGHNYKKKIIMKAGQLQ